MKWTIHQYVNNGQVKLSVLYLGSMPVAYVTDTQQISDEIINSKETKYVKIHIAT